MSEIRQCPGCGAKFQHDRVRELCKKCGLPDEVVAEGADAVGRWMRRAAHQGVPAALEAVGAGAGQAGSRLRRRKPHGRAGAAKKVARR